jgi:hypothetical protein
VARGLGDVDDRYATQFLQAFTAMLTETRLHDRVVIAVVAADDVHDADGGEVALEVALDRFGTEVGVRPMISVPREPLSG